MSPRPTTGHVRRPAILKAAAEVIAERGVIGTRIADVAERAGTSAPGVLYWFDTKDELLTEALRFSDEQFYAQLHRELQQLDGPRERLARIVELWPADGDDEVVLWMELWVRALQEPGAGIGADGGTVPPGRARLRLHLRAEPPGAAGQCDDRQQ